MNVISTDEIVRKAAEMTRGNIPWHHHYMPPSCYFSTDNTKHQLILENETTREVWVAKTEEKPLADLEKLEDLFFRKKFPQPTL